MEETNIVTYVHCHEEDQYDEDQKLAIEQEQKDDIRERANQQIYMVKAIQIEEFLHKYAHTAGEREITFYPITEEFDVEEEVYCYRQLVALCPKGIGGRAIALTEKSAERSHPNIVLQYRVIL